MTTSATATQSVPPARNIRADYLAEAETLRPFYAHSPHRPDFRAMAQQKNYPDDRRAELLRVLRQRYAELPHIDAVWRSLDALADSRTYTLTAGHQLNLMGGPMYVPLKVLTVAKLADQLNARYEDLQFVPVFWIHTEDHDFEEINHFASDFATRKMYPSPFVGATGRHVLTAEIRALIPANWPGELRDCYRPGRSLGEATLEFAHRLYGPYGVIVLDADHPELKALFRQHFARDLDEHFSQKAVETNSRALKEAGYPAQVHPRTVNLFYLDENGRDRLIPYEGKFAVDGREVVLSESEMKEVLQKWPERLSPNVVMRPLYQEWILPNLCYSGGWGELSYWLQLRELFRAADAAFPLLLPRMNATVFTPEQARAWRDLEFSLEEIREETHILWKKYLPKVWDRTEFDRLAAQLRQSYGDLAAYTARFSETLPRAAKGQGVKAEHFLANLEKKLHRVIRNDHPEPFQKIERLKGEIQPDHSVQERVLGLAAFSDYDPYKIVAQFYEACEPMDFSHKFIVLGKK